MEQDTEKLPVTRRESRKQDRRQAIVDAARTSFLEHGYAGTSMSGLLKTLGGSKATLWGYFRSKEDLFAAVVEEVSLQFRAEIQDVLATKADLECTLIAFCRAFLRKITSPDGQATWRLVVAESGRFPEVGKIFHERAARPVQGALQAFFARQVASGALIEEDPAVMVEALMGLCIGQHMRAIWGFERLNDAEIDVYALRFTHIFMRAYARGT
ncbi:AcrR family transcriptional regulator [Sphingobium sp. B7D2B]|uniref:TetR/AcrR family transcriptional regulator n=1 Tax=Sphingobium sp. B7D2B TaxID=2940583 RepID=UPI002225484A|nr:TetR/AcrR family transcriptional regulator [Sphingobium sp. B7D2B]MCW2367676.1 AcrR family transcriptional regulator [Sphingobium sp. B7D2B]